jgi:pre-mRNA-splicing factor CWC26
MFVWQPIILPQSLIMSLSAYLAKKYLNSSNSLNDPSDLSTRPKKRRKKDRSTNEPSTLIIADDEDLSLRNTTTGNADEEDRPIYDQSYHSAEFRRSKKNNWQTIATPASEPPDNDAAEADRILASAAADQAAHHAELSNEDAPAIVAAEDDPNTPKMSTGIRAGLQTAADSARLEQEEARKLAAEQKALKKSKKSTSASQPEAEAEQTVYRDATGRRIDVSMKRAEARAAELAKLKAEQKAKEDAMGDVQRAEKEKRKEDLEEARFLTVARGEDDEEMNEEMKGRLRWDDPMAGYMMQKQAEEAPLGRSSRAADGVTKPRRKEYVGAAPPNRYGIRPGWRWDGVDRGNGFEKEWFQARGKQARTKDLEYQWQMDE